MNAYFCRSPFYSDHFPAKVHDPIVHADFCICCSVVLAMVLKSPLIALTEPTDKLTIRKTAKKIVKVFFTKITSFFWLQEISSNNSNHQGSDLGTRNLKYFLYFFQYTLMYAFGNREKFIERNVRGNGI